MIAGLTIAALIGTWSCSSPSEPLSRFHQTYNRNGRASFSARYSNGATSHTTYTYKIESQETKNNGYLLTQAPNGFPTRVRVWLRGNRLEETPQQFFRRNEGWITSP